MTDDRLRVGIVGCGGIARLYTAIYADLVDMATVVAVADNREGRADHRADAITEAYRVTAHHARLVAADTRNPDTVGVEYERRAEAAATSAAHGIRRYDGYESLLADDDVQVVVLLTPPSLRAAPTIAAAESGRHVFTEGPMARSVEEADAMVEAVSTAGVKFVSQAVDRYPRGMSLARKAVESGLLGPIASANVEKLEYHPQTYYELGGITRAGGRMHRDWMGTWEGEGGGAVFHHGRYLIDPYLWVAGSRVTEVFAYSEPMLRKIETDSLTQALVRFDNGAIGTIHASLVAHRDAVSPGKRGRITIYGERASLVVNQDSFRGRVVTPVASADNANAATVISSDVVFASDGYTEAVEGLEALRDEVAHLPEAASQQDQTRYFLQNILDDTDPLVPIEVSRHHVEVSRGPSTSQPSSAYPWGCPSRRTTPSTPSRAGWASRAYQVYWQPGGPPWSS